LPVHASRARGAAALAVFFALLIGLPLLAAATALQSVKLLDAFTRLLPDDTWVSQLNLVDGAIELQGTTASASALVGLLEASPVVAKVRFRTPITADPVTKLERFELAVELRKS